MTTASTRPVLSKDGGTDNRRRLLLAVVVAAQFMEQTFAPAAVVFGPLYLDGLNAPGAQASGDAIWVCALAPAVASILGASTALVRRPA